MEHLENKFEISGNKIPRGREYTARLLAVIEFGYDDIKVQISGPSGECRVCRCEVWEHTIHELESLVCALRRASVAPFPESFEVATPDSWIGTVLRLRLAIEVELGLSLERPGQDCCRFFISSRNLLGHGPLDVYVATTLEGVFTEVLMEPSDCLRLASWLEAHIREYDQDLDDEEVD